MTVVPEEDIPPSLWSNPNDINELLSNELQSDDQSQDSVLEEYVYSGEEDVSDDEELEEEEDDDEEQVDFLDT